MLLKSLFFLSFLLVMGTAANAQFRKGTRMAGASILTAIYNSGTNEVSYPAPTNGYTAKSTSYNINLGPTLGWFISDQTAVGATLILNPAGNKTSFENGGTTFQRDEESSFNIGAGGFARNYFGGTGFLPFVQVGFNVGITSGRTEGFVYDSDILGPYKSTYDGESSGGFFTNANLSVGLTKLLNPNVGLDLSAGYIFSYTKTSFKTTYRTDYGNNGSIELTSVSDETRKFTNHGFHLGVGFQVFIGKRDK